VGDLKSVPNTNGAILMPMLNERDLREVLGKAHKSTQEITLDTPINEIFAPNQS
jgi:hypothetical protein